MRRYQLAITLGNVEGKNQFTYAPQPLVKGETIHERKKKGHADIILFWLSDNIA